MKKVFVLICVIYRCYANGGNGLGKAIRKAGRE